MRLWGHVWSVKLTVVLSRHFFNEDPGHCGPPCVCVSKCMAIIAVSNPESHSHFSLVNVIAVSFNVTVTVKVFVSCCFHMVRAMQFYQESYTQCHWMWNTNEYSCCTCHRKQSKGYQRSRHGEPFVYNSSWTDSSAARKTERVACVAWRFWLGALSNKGARAPGSTKPPCYAGYRTSDLLIVIKIKWVIVDKDDSENRQWHIKEHHQKHFKLTEHFE